MPRIKNKPIPSLSQKDIQRFWEKVDRSGGADACWPWLGRRHGQKGYHYGRFRITLAGKRQWFNANRIALYLHLGYDPGDSLACHSCDNPPCCNGNHLNPGTPLSNSTEAMERGRLASGDKNALRRHPELAIKGTAHHRALLSDKNVVEIRHLYAVGGTSYAKLGRRFNVAETTIGHIVTRITWKHI